MMGQFFLGLIGMALGFGMIKYREMVGDTIGEADWMRKLGGVYNVMFISGVLVFFFSLAYATHTTDLLFAPLRSVMPSFGAEEMETF